MCIACLSVACSFGSCIPSSTATTLQRIIIIFSLTTSPLLIQVNNSGSRAPLERSLRWKRKGSERESEVKREEGVPIFVTKMLFWCRHVSCLLSRRRHVQYTSRGEVERLRKTAILESAAEMPLHTRSTTEPRLLLSTTCSTSNTTSAIRILDETIEAMRSSLGTQSGKRAVYAASRAFKVSSLSHFITECRRLRRQIGECRDTNNRVLLRQTLRNFWTDNVDGALACCALRGRDFGFVAGLGLADDGLHVSFTALNLAVCSVTQEKNTCTCTDMVLSLHYVARELNFIERMHRRGPDPHKGKKFERKKGIRDDRNSPNGEGTSNSNKEIGRGGPTQEELQHLRRTVATLGLERIHYFFLQRDASGAVLGTAEDALHVLEFLSIVDIDDAEDSARVLFEATKPRSRKKIHQFAVTSLLRHVVSNCKDLKFTSVVHAFRLLRIFLPVTCPDSPTKLSPPPPLPPRTKEWKSGINSAAPRVLSHTIDAFRGDPHDETVFVSGGAEYLEWKRQLETMDRILWGLFAALQKKDARFINAFHFVQIVETLSRLPRHLLSRVPQPKRGRPQGVGGTMVSNPTLEAAAVYAAHSGNRSSDGEVISLEELWAYLVAKACIFIPGMSSDQRRRVCYNLRVAVMSRAVCFQCEVEDMLQPMAHELSQYPKDFDAVMFDRTSPGGARGCFYTGSGA